MPDTPSSSPFTAPHTSPVSDFPEQPPPKLFTLKAMAVATYLSGPLGGAILCGINFHRLKQPTRRNHSFIMGLLSTYALIWLLFTIPEAYLSKVPDFLIPVLYTPLLTYLIKLYQGSDLEKHFAASGPKGSGWTVFSVSVVSILIFIAISIPFVLNAPSYGFEGKTYSYLDTGHKIYHDESLPLETLEQIGHQLENVGYFNTEYTDEAQVKSFETQVTLSIGLLREYWKDPQTLAALNDLYYALAELLPDKQLQIHLVDAGFTETHETIFEPDPAAKPTFSNFFESLFSP